MAMKVTLLVLFVLLAQVYCDTGKLKLVVAYCPTYFTGGGAIVSVDTTTGKWAIDTTFKWPSEVQLDGCAGSAMDDPAYLLDRTDSSMYFDFVDDFGALVKLNLLHGTSSIVKPSDFFFTGYENMALDSESKIVGLSATVTEDGFCNNGCFETTFMYTSNGQMKKLGLFPYKALMDNSNFLDSKNNKLWVQASYPLESSAYCSKTPSDLCLVSIDLATNKLTMKYTNWTVFKFSDSIDADGNLLCWMEGFDQLCNNPYDDFLFAKVNLETAKATPIACIPKNVVDQEDPGVSSFSLDNQLLATASGDGDAGEAQLLILHTQTGAVLYNNKLDGLGQALKSVNGLYWVWSVSFI